jgi:hypothetical protein
MLCPCKSFISKHPDPYNPSRFAAGFTKDLTQRKNFKLWGGVKISLLEII